MRTKPTILQVKRGKEELSIKKRIAMLGDMNDRYVMALNNRDKAALNELAAEYESLGCPRLANEIRAEAKAIRRKRAAAHAGNVDTSGRIADSGEMITGEMITGEDPIAEKGGARSDRASSFVARAP